MLSLNDANFNQEIENAQKPILVDFWSNHCLPCYMLFPVMEKLAEEYKDRVIFAKINIDESPSAARNYEIDRIPMVLLFKQGKPLSGFVGAQPEEIIRNWLEENLKEKEV